MIRATEKQIKYARGLIAEVPYAIKFNGVEITKGSVLGFTKNEVSEIITKLKALKSGIIYESEKVINHDRVKKIIAEKFGDNPILDTRQFKHYDSLFHEYFNHDRDYEKATVTLTAMQKYDRDKFNKLKVFRDIRDVLIKDKCDICGTKNKPLALKHVSKHKRMKFLWQTVKAMPHIKELEQKLKEKIRLEVQAKKRERLPKEQYLDLKQRFWGQFYFNDLGVYQKEEVMKLHYKQILDYLSFLDTITCCKYDSWAYQ